MIQTTGSSESHVDVSKQSVVSALIADDEPILRNALIAELGNLWPELRIVAAVGDGDSATREITRLQPDIVFLDIRMPGSTGIDVAQTIAEDWPEQADHKPPPLIVFVTAYNEYAIDAFGAAAIDYLLKPVTTDRLVQTVHRLQGRIRDAATPDVTTLSRQLNRLMVETNKLTAPSEPPEPLRTIRASIGDAVRMIAVNDVVLFESADKYVLVYTAEHEAVIREPLRNLLPRLDPQRFTQIHRGAIVNLDLVDAAVRHENGKMSLQLKGIDKSPAVSRMYRHLFQPM